MVKELVYANGRGNAWSTAYDVDDVEKREFLLYHPGLIAALKRDGNHKLTLDTPEVIAFADEYEKRWGKRLRTFLGGDVPFLALYSGPDSVGVLPVNDGEGEFLVTTADEGWI